MGAAAIPANEKERLNALREYLILDSEEEQVFDEVVMLASFICNTPMSTIALIDENRQWFKSKFGTSITEVPRDVSLCAHTILQDDILVVNDTTKDERFSDNPLVVGPPDIRFYAGMPLISPEGHKLGTLCVADTMPKQLTEQQQFALKVLRNQVMKLFELRKKNMALARMRDTHNKLLSVIGHDLRGPLKSINGMLRLSEDYDLSLEEYKEFIPRMRQMVITTENLLSNLLLWAKNQIDGKSTSREYLNLNDLVQNIISMHRQLFETKKNKVVVDIDIKHQILIDKNRMEFVLRNLLLNANKYMNNGTVKVNAQIVNAQLRMCVSDSGIGIEEEKHAMLFEWGKRNSTQGTGGELGSGLGLPMCKEFVEEMGGAIWLQSKENEGASFYFTVSLQID